MPDGLIVVANAHLVDYHNMAPVKNIGGLTAALAPVIGKNGVYIGSARGPYDSVMVSSGNTLMVEHNGHDIHTKKVFVPKKWSNGFSSFSDRYLWLEWHNYEADLNSVRDLTYPNAHFDDSAADDHILATSEFATTTASVARSKPGMPIFFQDYQMDMLPLKYSQLSQELGLNNRFGQFIHIPFPDPKIIVEKYGRDSEQVGYMRQVVRSLTKNNWLGFHAQRFAQNFLDSIEVYGVTGVTVKGDTVYNGHDCRVVVDPIGVDVESILSESSLEKPLRHNFLGEDLMQQMRRSRENGLVNIVKLGRLDPTKRYADMLDDFDALLQEGFMFSFKATAVNRSRMGNAEYQDLEKIIDQKVYSINSRFARPGFTPIMLSKDSIPLGENYRTFREADIIMLDSAADGQNLTGKEGAIANSALPYEQRASLISGPNGFEMSYKDLGVDDGLMRLNVYDAKQRRAQLASWIGKPGQPSQRRPLSDAATKRILETSDIHAWVDRSVAGILG